MSLKTRGQDVTLRVAVDGVIKGGTWRKAKNFMATPRIDLNEDDYIEEQETDLDIQANGWDGSFELDMIDAEALDVTDDIIEREQEHVSHPDITITVTYNFREPGTRGRMYVYHECFMKPEDEGAGSRKDKVKQKFMFKAKRRTPLNV